jgi:hypothetical protein
MTYMRSKWIKKVTQVTKTPFLGRHVEPKLKIDIRS